MHARYATLSADNFPPPSSSIQHVNATGHKFKELNIQRIGHSQCWNVLFKNNLPLLEINQEVVSLHLHEMKCRVCGHEKLTGETSPKTPLIERENRL